MLSRNKPVTVSSIELGSSHAGARAVDGDLSTRWASVDGHDPEWITVDLGANATLSRVVLKWEAAYAKAYRIELSTNNLTWYPPVFSTTTGNGATDDLTIAGTGRYVRLFGTQRGTPWGYSLFELEVYGTTGQTTTQPPPTATTSTPPAPSATTTSTPTTPPTSSSKIVGGYWPNWVPGAIRIRDVNRNYNLIYLFHAQPVGGSPGTSGAVYFNMPGNDRGAATNFYSDIQYARTAQKRKIILSIGGAGNGMSFPTRAKSQNLVNSVVALYNQFGGFDGIDWNTFEGEQAPDTAEMIWMSLELKRLYPGFMVTSPPAPWSSRDLSFAGRWWPLELGLRWATVLRRTRTQSA